MKCRLVTEKCSYSPLVPENHTYWLIFQTWGSSVGPSLYNKRRHLGRNCLMRNSTFPDKVPIKTTRVYYFGWENIVTAPG